MSAELRAALAAVQAGDLVTAVFDAPSMGGRFTVTGRTVLSPVFGGLSLAGLGMSRRGGEPCSTLVSVAPAARAEDLRAALVGLLGAIDHDEPLAGDLHTAIRLLDTAPADVLGGV